MYMVVVAIMVLLCVVLCYIGEAPDPTVTTPSMESGDVDESDR